MKNYLFLVEGIADVTFLRDYFLYFFPEAEPIKYNIKEKEVKINLNDNSITIKGIGGCSAVKNNLKPRLEEITDQNIELIIIQDTDNMEIKDGGFENRIKYLNQIKLDLDIDFDIFLFPNNKDNGDLETLLLSIVIEEKYVPYYTNYENYALNLTTFSQKQFSDELLLDKQKVFSYFQAYQGIKNSKEENRKYESEFWNLGSNKLQPFAEFLRKKIKQYT